MIKVIGKDSKIAKQTTCRRCSNILEFLPIDVVEEKRTDYTGDTDIYKTITCPCGNKITVGFA